MGKVAGIEGLVKPWIVAMGSYVASKAPDTLEGKVEVPVADIIKLDANENPYGCSPRVQQALAGYPALNIYPDADQGELRQILSEYVGVKPECIVAGNGSDELIGYIMRSLVGPGDEVINCRGDISASVPTLIPRYRLPPLKMVVFRGVDCPSSTVNTPFASGVTLIVSVQMGLPPEEAV